MTGASCSTSSCQLLKLWQPGSEERENRIKWRKEMCNRRRKKMDAGEWSSLGSFSLMPCKLSVWSQGTFFSNSRCGSVWKPVECRWTTEKVLKGSTAAKVADKERIRILLSTNAATIDAIPREALQLSAEVHHPLSSKKTVLVNSSPAVKKTLKTLNRTITFRTLDCMHSSSLKPVKLLLWLLLEEYGIQEWSRL